ncbi:MAG: hypothetical protein SFZ02_21010 [bacterium]|nr:hypothetical protein [bacterium]
MPEITVSLSDELMTKLQTVANRDHMPIEAWVQTALADVLDDDDTRSEEQILASFRSALKGALSGDLGRPAQDVLDEIKRELAEHAHEG